MIETIEIRYFGGGKYPELPWNDKTIFGVSKKKDSAKRIRNHLIDIIIDAGYNVMIQTNIPSTGDGFQIIWIDKYRFQQR